MPDDQYGASEGTRTTDDRQFVRDVTCNNRSKAVEADSAVKCECLSCHPTGGVSAENAVGLLLAACRGLLGREGGRLGRLGIDRVVPKGINSSHEKVWVWDLRGSIYETVVR